MKTLLMVLILSFASATISAQSAISGAWCWFNQIRTIRYVGTKDQVYFSWVRTDGYVMIGSRNSTTGAVQQFALHSFATDDHDVPGIIILATGRIATFYSHHTSATIYYRISTNPEDVASWMSERVLITDSTRLFTYPKPVRLASEGKIYVSWRDGNSALQDSLYHSWMTSTDLDSITTDVAATWSGKVQFFNASTTGTNDPNATAYAFVTSNGTDTMYFTHSQHPFFDPEPHNVLAFYYKAGSFYRPDGSLITSTVPVLAQSDLSGSSLIYDWTINGRRAWIWDIALDGSGKPVIVFVTFVSTSDHRYNYAHWTGSAWNVHEISAGGGTIAEDLVPDPGQVYYSGGISIDPSNTNTVYFSTNASGGFIIRRAVTSDDGASWVLNTMLGTYATKSTRPQVIPNHDSASILMWQSGSYPSYVSFPDLTLVLSTSFGLRNSAYAGSGAAIRGAVNLRGSAVIGKVAQ